MLKMIIKLALLLLLLMTQISHAEKCQKSNGMLRCRKIKDATMLKGVTSCVVDRRTEDRPEKVRTAEKVRGNLFNGQL